PENNSEPQVSASPDLAGELARRRAYGAVVGPRADVVDLLLHGFRERHDIRRRVQQVVVVDFAVLEACGGERGNDTLLNFGAGPSLGEALQPFQVEGAWVDAAPLQVNPEDLDALVVERNVDEEDLVEASLADHLGGQQ